MSFGKLLGSAVFLENGKSGFAVNVAEKRFHLGKGDLNKVVQNKLGFSVFINNKKSFA